MEYSKIAVIDVETPNINHDAICSIGIVTIENGVILDRIYHLINPETHFDKKCTHIHNISEKDVVNSPTFPEIWEMIKNFFSDYLIIGHNVTFDLACIKKSLHRFNIDAVPVYYADTLTMSRRNIANIKSHALPSLCSYFNIQLESHHNAIHDSEATAELFLELACSFEINVDDYINKYSFDADLDNTESTGKKSKRFSATTKSLQELQGVLYGVTCDGVLTDDEIYAIRDWMTRHIDLKGNYPFDKILYSINKVLEDNIITEAERKELFSLFNKILYPTDEVSDNNIDVNDAKICLTGEFDCMSKNELAIELENQGAIIKKEVVKDLKYLVVGSKGSENWSHGNYGNKVKKAMMYNEKGNDILIIKETDFIPFVIDE